MSTQPLRVAMLSIHTCPQAAPGGKKTGGMNVYIRELARELRLCGVQVDIFTRSQDDCADHIQQPDLFPHVRLIHIPAGSTETQSPYSIYKYLPEFVAGVEDFARSESVVYDLIHSHYWLSGWAGQQLQKKWGVPLIQMFHTLGHMKNRIATTPEEQEPPIRIQVEQEIMATADRLVAATPAERVQLMWLYGADMHKIRIIPPGVDIARFHPLPKERARSLVGVPQDNRLLLFVGRIERLKGLDTLFQALAVLIREAPVQMEQICVSIIGGSAQSESDEDLELRRLNVMREELGLARLVTFLGSKSQESLQDYYTAAEAVIMPSYYESFGMVALEAMACGTPVIASGVGGLAYLIEDGVTGFHVPDHDAVELAGKISLLLANDELRGEMSAAAVKAAQDYAWPRIAAQIDKLYREVTAPQTKPPLRS